MKNEQRLTILRKARHDLQCIPHVSICFAIHLESHIKPYMMLDTFPEFARFKPESAGIYGHWFAEGIEGNTDRLSAIDEVIQEIENL